MPVMAPRALAAHRTLRELVCDGMDGHARRVRSGEPAKSSLWGSARETHAPSGCAEQWARCPACRPPSHRCGGPRRPLSGVEGRLGQRARGAHVGESECSSTVLWDDNSSRSCHLTRHPQRAGTCSSFSSPRGADSSWMGHIGLCTALRRSGHREQPARS